MTPMGHQEEEAEGRRLVLQEGVRGGAEDGRGQQGPGGGHVVKLFETFVVAA